MIIFVSKNEPPADRLTRLGIPFIIRKRTAEEIQIDKEIDEMMQEISRDTRRKLREGEIESANIVWD